MFLLLLWLLVLTIRFNRLDRAARAMQAELNRISAHPDRHAPLPDSQPQQAEPSQPLLPSQPLPHTHTASDDITASPRGSNPQPLPRTRTASAANTAQTAPETKAAAHSVRTDSWDAPSHDTGALSEANFARETSLPQREPMWPQLRAQLVAAGLWPKTSGSSLETQLTSFIVTRLGVILGVAALVFLAVYLGRNTPPWVRFIELLLVPVAFCGAARLLRTRVPAFAQVLLAGGMAMFYFVSFAAYAVPAVRVVEQAWLGFGLQIATLLTIGVIAGSRRDPTLAVLAQVLGFVACSFAWYHGLTPYLLSGSFLLGAGGALLYAARQWRSCLWLGLLGAYAFFLLLLNDPAHGGSPANWVQWSYPLLAYLLFFASERLSAMRLQVMDEQATRLHHSANAALALLAGLVAIYTFQPERIEYFYLGAAVVAAGCAYLFRYNPPSERIAHQFVLKASLLFSLFLLEILEGNIRCLALLLQALIMLESTRRHPAKATLSAATAAWLFSLGAFLYAYFSHGRELWQPATVWLWVYLSGSAALLLFAARVLPRIVKAQSYQVLQMIGGALLGLVALITTFYPAYAEGETIAVAVVNSLLLLLPILAALYINKRLPQLPKAESTARQHSSFSLYAGASIALGISLCWAHMSAWHLLSIRTPESGAVVPIWVAVTIGLSLLLVIGGGFSSHFRLRAIQHVLLILASYTFYALCAALTSATATLLYAVLAGSLIALWAALPRYRILGYARLLPLLFATAGLLFAPPPQPLSNEAFAVGWIALALATSWQIALPYWKVLDGELPELSAGYTRWAQAVLLLLAVSALVRLVPQPLTQAILLTVFTAFALLLHKSRTPLLWLAQALALLLLALFLNWHLWANKSETLAPLYAIQVALSTMTILLMQCLRHHLPASLKDKIFWIQAIAGLLALLPLIGIPTQLLEPRTWLSLWYALPAFALIAVGLALHCRPYRLLGLFTLLLPLARLFVADIRDTVSRIIAFGLVALLLLLTGYIYNRIMQSDKPAR